MYIQMYYLINFFLKSFAWLKEIFVENVVIEIKWYNFKMIYVGIKGVNYEKYIIEK